MNKKVNDLKDQKQRIHRKGRSKKYVAKLLDLNLLDLNSLLHVPCLWRYEVNEKHNYLGTTIYNDLVTIACLFH